MDVFEGESPENGVDKFGYDPQGTEGLVAFVDTSDAFRRFVEAFNTFRAKVIPDDSAEDELDDFDGEGAQHGC